MCLACYLQESPSVQTKHCDRIGAVLMFQLAVILSIVNGFHRQLKDMTDVMSNQKKHEGW